MTMTLHLSPKRQVVLPKELCHRQNLKPGTTLHVTEIGNGLYVSAGLPPSEKELRAIFRSVDGRVPSRGFTAEDEDLIALEIKACRAAGGRRKV